jgi:hypothetical protein
MILAVALLALGTIYATASEPGRPLQYYGTSCAGCHLRVALEWDGPATAALSKGVHPIMAHLIASKPSVDANGRTQATRVPRTADACRACHADTHKNWSTSAHGRAFRNPIFQHAFKRDRKAWCLHCHAPLWDPAADGTAEQVAERPDFEAGYAEGINCVACHVRDGGIVGLTDYTNSKAELFHPVRPDPGLRGKEFCAGCHQFNFVHNLEPFAVYEGDEHPMQNVVREAAMTNGDLYPAGCLSCHYAGGDHSLKSEGRAALREKIRIELHTTAAIDRPASQHEHAGESAAYRVRLELSMPRLGHHFPTGDLFRILSFYVFDAAGRTIYRYDFRKEVRVIDRAVVQDTTLKPRPNEPGASRIVEATVVRKPARCLVVYRLQGAIDPEIARDFADPGVLRETIYDGACN